MRNNTTTNTTEIEFDDIAFEVNGINIGVSGQMDVVYDYHPEQEGDRDTPTKDAYAEVSKINPTFPSLEIVIDNPALPTSVEVSTWAKSEYHADENKTWGEYVFKHADNLLTEYAIKELDRKFEDCELDEMEVE